QGGDDPGRVRDCQVGGWTLPLDAEFFRVADPLRVPSMGTENVAPLLYALVSMLRPTSVLEIGAGYTTLFLARALADAANEARCDRQQLERAGDDGERVKILSDAARKDYRPHLYVIDDLHHPKTSADKVESGLTQLNLGGFATMIEGTFAGSSSR